MHLICDRVDDGIATLVLDVDSSVRFTSPVAHFPGLKSGDWIRLEFDEEATERAAREAAGLIEKLRGET